ncbi:hypothetical protein Tco_0972482 [Tanacetum coccineum]
MTMRCCVVETTRRLSAALTFSPTVRLASNSQLNDKGFVDSGCSRHMTGNISHFLYFKDFDGGYVTFGGGAYGGRFTGKEVSTALPEVNTVTPEDLVGPIPASEDTQVEHQEIKLGNIPQSYAVPTTPHTRIHKDTLIEHVIGDVQSFEEPKDFLKALSDPAWVKAMKEQLLQFKLQKVWILVDLPKGHRAIGTKIKGGWLSETKQDLFEDPDTSDKVYKGREALYGLQSRT